MKDFVSRYWISILALVVALSVFSAVLGPSGFVWKGLGWLVLVAAAAYTLVRRVSAPSMAEVIHDVESEVPLKKEGRP